MTQAEGSGMGLFGSSPEKKLEKARELESRGVDHDARQLYAEILDKPSKLSPATREAAEKGYVQVRTRMIHARLDEAERFRLIGDLEAARDRCQTALDLAGDDLDRSEIEEKLRQVDSPKRPAPQSTRAEDEVPDDLLSPPEEAPEPMGSLLEWLKPKRPVERSDEELFGEDPDSLFELHLETLGAETADRYRAFGSEFRNGYLALVQGAAHRALEFFDRMPADVQGDPWVLLERAHALLLDERAEDSLALLARARENISLITPETTPEPAAPTEDAGGAALPPGFGAGGSAGTLPSGHEEVLVPVGSPVYYLSRVRFLEVEALRASSRYEEAVAAAKELASTPGVGRVAADSILAWTLIEAGRHEEAYAMLLAYLRNGSLHEEILVPAAQAASLLGRREEAIRLLEGLLQSRFQRSLERQIEVDFPVEAGRRLLEFYLEGGRHPDQIRGLVQHLVDHDPDQGESYRDLLLKLR